MIKWESIAKGRMRPTHQVRRRTTQHGVSGAGLFHCNTYSWDQNEGQLAVAQRYARMKARHAGCRRIQTIFRKNRVPCYLPCRTGIPVLHDGDTLGKATKNHLLACPGVFPAEVRDPCIRKQVDDTAVQVFESSCKSCGCMNARVTKSGGWSLHIYP